MSFRLESVPSSEERSLEMLSASTAACSVTLREYLLEHLHRLEDHSTRQDGPTEPRCRIHVRHISTSTISRGRQVGSSSPSSSYSSSSTAFSLRSTTGSLRGGPTPMGSGSRSETVGARRRGLLSSGSLAFELPQPRSVVVKAHVCVDDLPCDWPRLGETERRDYARDVLGIERAWESLPLDHRLEILLVVLLYRLRSGETR